MLCVKYVHQDSFCFWLVKLTKKQGAYVDSQFWQFRGRPVRPVCLVVIRVGFVLFWKFLYKSTWRGVRLPQPINIKAKADWGYSQSNQINLHYFCSSQTLTFPNPNLLFFLRPGDVWRHSEWTCQPQSNPSCASSDGVPPELEFLGSTWNSA